ncbi:hypothetical protein GCM10009750_15010 [Agromyces salentinus]|uniref:Uncharacterized protein n=1 Tax=Agromyces salentinus TaxID=269421 RepID=A0ABP4Z0L9_9MICO
MRSRTGRRMQVTPVAMQSAKRPDAACWSVAPTAAKPAMTSAKELAKPVIAAMTPAMTVWKMAVRG